MLKIVADENIPYVRELFSELGSITLCSGRAMTPDMLRDADVLLVRSVTKVNAALLAGSPVKFVGTATIGADHVDESYLASRQIRFTTAAGSNSNSVAEYVMTAQLLLAERFGWNIEGKTLGIIGVGNIGTKVADKAKALGLHLLFNDPPKQRLTGDKQYIPLADLLAAADFVTCHVPLTKSGPDPTYHLLDTARLNVLRTHTLLINSSRGEVVDNQALKKILSAQKIRGAVLDVWEPEPNLNPQLLALTEIATPHIAGYSFDGKVNGAVMLYRELCAMLHRQPTLSAEDLLPAPPVKELTLAVHAGSDQALLCQALTAIYDLPGDDARMRQILNLPPNEQASYFDKLRKNYPIRRESHNTLVRLDQPRPALAEKLRLLGFKVC